MTCLKCGQEIRDGERYCPHCGAQQQQYGSPQTPAAGKKKKFGFKGFVIVLLALLAGRFAGYLFGSGVAKSLTGGSANTSARTVLSSPSSQSVSDSLASVVEKASVDLMIRHETVEKDQGDGFTVYQTIFYGMDTNTLEGWNVEFVGRKANGYTLESFKAAGFESSFPSFTEAEYYETSDAVSAVFKMRELKNTDRLKSLAEYELIEPYGPGEKVMPLDAPYLIQSLQQNGWDSVKDPDVIGRLHLLYGTEPEKNTGAAVF